MPVATSDESAAPAPVESQPPVIKSAVTNPMMMPNFGGAAASFTADAGMVGGRAGAVILPPAVQLESPPKAPLQLHPHQPNLTGIVGAPSLPMATLPMAVHSFPAHGVSAVAPPPLPFQQHQQLLQQQHAAQLHVAQLQQQQLHTRSMMMQQMAIHQQQQQQHIFQQQQQVAAMQQHRQQQQQQMQMQSSALMAASAPSPLMQQSYQVPGAMFSHPPTAPLMAQGSYLPPGVPYPHMHAMQSPVHFGGPQTMQTMQSIQQQPGAMEPPINGGNMQMDPMFALHQQQMRIQQQQQQQQQMNAAFHHQQQQQAALQQQQQLQQLQHQQHLQMSQPHPAPYVPSAHSTPSTASMTVALPSSASSSSLSGMASAAASSTSNSPSHTPSAGGPVQLAIKVPSPSLMLSPPLHAQSVHTINTPMSSRSPTAISASATPLRLVGGATLALPASASGGRHSAISPRKSPGAGVLASMLAPGSRPHLLARPVLAKAIPAPAHSTSSITSPHKVQSSPPASALHTLSLLSRGSTGSATSGDVTPTVAVVAVPVVPRRSHHKRKTVPDEELLRRRRLRELDAQEEVARELRVARMDADAAAAASASDEHENMDVLSALVAVASSSAMQSTSMGASSSSSHHREHKRARHSHQGSSAASGSTRLSGVSTTSAAPRRSSGSSRPRDESVGSDSEEEHEFESAGRAEEDGQDDAAAAAAEEDEEGTDDDQDEDDGEEGGSSSGPASPATPRSSGGGGGGGGGRSRYCLPCPLVSHLPKVPLQTLYLQVQKQYTVSKKEMEARRYTSSEREELVSVPVRIMGSARGGGVYFVAKDVCLLVYIRKGNVAKSIGQFLPHEKARLPVLCPRSNGTSSTHVLTALSVAGLRRLLKGSKSPLAGEVLKFLLGHVKAMAASLAKAGAGASVAASAGGAVAAPQARKISATVTERINMTGAAGQRKGSSSAGDASRKAVRPTPAAAAAAAAAMESDDEGSDAHSGSVESHSDEEEDEYEEEDGAASPIVSSSRRSSLSASATVAVPPQRVVRAIARDVSSTARPRALAVITSDSFIIAPRGGGKASAKTSS